MATLHDSKALKIPQELISGQVISSAEFPSLGPAQVGHMISSMGERFWVGLCGCLEKLTLPEPRMSVTCGWAHRVKLRRHRRHCCSNEKETPEESDCESEDGGGDKKPSGVRKSWNW